jgi:hypothetical protein
MSTQGVRFTPGTVVSPGEYRNTRTGQIRYFDGNTPLPGSVNSASWQQVSDHYHAHDDATAAVASRQHGPAARPVRFAPGAVVSPGEYRNTDTGQVRYFDGNTPLPGSVNSASWEQVSDHFHAHAEATTSAAARQHAAPSHPVRFAPGTLVSPGEYRNTKTGVVRFFDGNTPLPGGPNSPSWQQVSDHYHAEAVR